ncbi:hypothetical protein [Pseudomonas sp. FEN]|nr:hypothetical protein [Pseudomonas sp. FEN]
MSIHALSCAQPALAIRHAALTAPGTAGPATGRRKPPLVARSPGATDPGALVKMSYPPKPLDPADYPQA